ncbi:2-hydroxyacyl-CoA dehydratase family protein [Anaeromicropila populeti]|uniref:Benzoyl-CoA reductase/2-hydroxyglutaryl-CoA dehydratase subunit, BcrC/BadD/HgdB n=1 Tax=Anaeromicropila populeti TaxID=37658 RepID=A0A1I6LJ63_9FIRM|nr:2-hydroxyacyl-CoA dehydratase family protein [Anaeromicropila populeti]SFS03382.1 Benzoyl-CoA reductase/2-hydroxyglutaryl-CoA dehydratase subunit, BcrC/BadD/HgdB [Anaeromicropila populeti]
MPDKKTITYESEFIDTLNQLLRSNKKLAGAKYFLDTTYHYFHLNTMKTRRPKVIVLGNSIPEEYIYAAGKVPFWILGGSLSTASWADDLVPRDTDPVSQSMLGYLMNDKFNLAKEAVIIVPVTCDSTRKIVFLLKRAGYRVITADIPPNKQEPLALYKWVEQMRRLTEELSAYTGHTITRQSLLEASKVTDRARRLMREFLESIKGREHIISDPLRMVIVNSYYYTENITKWCGQLQSLIKEIKALPCCYNASTMRNKPNVLLMGSPVVFPNYKIPFLIQDIGLRICANADILTEKIYLEEVKKTGRKKEDIFQAIAMVHYKGDCSAAYANNKTLYDRVRYQMKTGNMEGVVYHVLKGQIEYDFELAHYEELFSAYGIPVFRLETDYQYQDVEQIRIRMEAFMEMLVQNQYSSGRYKSYSKEKRA